MRALRRPVLVSLLALSSCGGKVAGGEAVKPEPVAGLVLFDSYGALVEAVFAGLMQGDHARVQASIATPGQIATMCPQYPAPAATPFSVPSVPVGSQHCQEVFAPFKAESIERAFETHPLGRKHTPIPDDSFQSFWAQRCPESFRVFMVPTILEFDQEGQERAGIEVSDVFTHEGKWGLMSIPRCRGAGE